MDQEALDTILEMRLHWNG